MPIEIQWTEEHPETGEKRIVSAEKWAGEWTFKWKNHRREDWRKGLRPNRAMWQHILDSLKRRYQRNEGVSDEDIRQVEQILTRYPPEEDEND